VRAFAERILHRVKFNHVFLPIVINTGLGYDILLPLFHPKIARVGHGSSCMRASIGKCSTVSLSIHCNVKSEFANPSSFTISFRYDERDIIPDIDPGV